MSRVLHRYFGKKCAEWIRRREREYQGIMSRCNAVFLAGTEASCAADYSVKLPGLILDTQPVTALQMLAHVSNSREAAVKFDAADLTAIEPVGVCLLAASAHRAQSAGKQLVIRNGCTTLQRLLTSTRAEITWAHTNSVSPLTGRSTLAMAAATPAEANAVANKLSAEIAEFIPAEDRQAMVDHYGLQIYHAVQPALAYVLTELVDNVFSHSRTNAFPRPTAWLAAQWYAAGDLVRVAAVDDGCGLLASLRGLAAAPANHFDAARVAFRPFVSSKSAPLIYADRRHMGLGLTICRDICQRLQGQIYAASGNARVVNAGLGDEKSQRLEPSYQGTIVSLEFHRRAATTRTIQEIVAKYSGTPDLRARFD
jgi:signal transduction histidine kinase